MKRWIAIGVLGFACTPTRSEAPTSAAQRPVGPEARVVAPSEVATDDASTLPRERDDLCWTWIDERPVDAQGRAWDPDPYTVAAGDLRLRVHQGDALAIERLDGPAPWTVRFEDHPNRARVVVDDVAAYVVYFHAMSSGARIAKLALVDGAAVYDRPLQGLGPIGHSKYFNDVQLERNGDWLHVHGFESAGAYVEEVDPASGSSFSYARPAPELAALSWAWDGDADAFEYREPSFELEGYGTVRVDFEDLALPGGKRVALGDGFASSRPAAAALLDDGTLYVAYGDAHSSGASLIAVDITKGTERWHTPLRGVGPTAHSEYFNQLQIAIVRDHVVVYGNESNGRYLEVVGRDGSPRVNKRWEP